MIDIILQAPNKATMRTFAIARGLLVDDGDGGYTEREGFHWGWWAGSGDFPIDNLVPPTLAPGVVALMRIHGGFFDSDQITNPVDNEQWSRSKIARFIKNNGTPGTTAGIPWYELDSVQHR